MPDADEDTSPAEEAPARSSSATTSDNGAGLALVCPLRGELKATAKRKDLLGPSEEKLRIDMIRHLISLGYPTENMTTEAIVYRLGNAGRNSLRTDVVVYDIAAEAAKALDNEQRLLHAVILGEVKRDNSSAKAAKETQVKPLLGPAKVGALAVYWDDVEQRVFWHDKEKHVKEAPLVALPLYGVRFKSVPKMTLADLKPFASVRVLFDRIEDILHGESVDKESRYTVMLQLLLAKLYDELENEADDTQPLGIQDPISLEMDADVTLSNFNMLLAKAVAYFGANLPKAIPTEIQIKASTLTHVLPLLADKDFTHVAPRLMQDFFMSFAKNLYKWDLAQYFTPTVLTEFIVSLANPQFNEKVKDPASGSSDFLMATHRRREGRRRQTAITLFGADDSETAIQVSELNKVLHGTTSVDLVKEDSLENIQTSSNVVITEKNGEKTEDGKYDVVICNPPFGTRITERRPVVLKNFQMGHDWNGRMGEFSRLARIQNSQQKGILFVEACVRMVKKGTGRVAIVVPNGYLGNRSAQYHILRDWLLRHCRVAAIVSFPRFTFKQSGADVSASVILLERRATPLKSAKDDTSYSFAVEMVERPGWELGNKVGKPTWVRDESDGTELVIDGEKVLDSDLGDVLERLQASTAHNDFPWLAGAGSGTASGRSVSIADVVRDPHLTLDPKRHSRKNIETRLAITAVEHFKLGDVLQIIPEKTAGNVNRKASATYRYVEIGDVGAGTYSWHEYKGWQLPDRAKHEAEPGDIYVGGIWNSVNKWFMAGGDTTSMTVTNGFIRARIKPGKEKYVTDIVGGLCMEAYSVQMRAMARGSDGLAEITNDDFRNVVLPVIKDATVRKQIEDFAKQLKKGHTSIKAAVDTLGADGQLPVLDNARRSSHVVLV